MSQRFLRSTIWLALAISCLPPASPNATLQAGDGVAQLQEQVRSTGPFEEPKHWSPPPAQPSQPNPPSFPQQNYYSDDDSDDFFDSELTTLIAIGAVFAASSPFWGPARLVGDDYSSDAYFPRYPYQEPLDGYLMVEPYLPRKPREWAGRASLEYGGDFGNQELLAARLLLDTTWRLGLDTAARYYIDRPALGIDELWVGDANVVFRFAQSPKLAFRTGVGINWLSDRIGQDTGFNFTYAADWFVVQPLIVSAEIDWGELGHASLFHMRTTVGAQWHRAEIYTGYDYLDVGNAQLDAWIAGMRFWF